MYWKVDEYIDDYGNTWIIYNYLTLKNVYKSKPNLTYYYNPNLQQIAPFPPEVELVVYAGIAHSEEAWEEWYEENKNL